MVGDLAAQVLPRSFAFVLMGKCHEGCRHSTRLTPVAGTRAVRTVECTAVNRLIRPMAPSLAAPSCRRYNALRARAIFTGADVALSRLQHALHRRASAQREVGGDLAQLEGRPSTVRTDSGPPLGA